MEQKGDTSSEGIIETLSAVKQKLARHLSELGLDPTEFTDDFIQELADANFLKKNGIAFSAHNEAVTAEQIKLVDDAAIRMKQTQTEISSYLDQQNILSIVINPKIN